VSRAVPGLAAGVVDALTLRLIEPVLIPWIQHGHNKACEEAIANHISNSVAQLNKFLNESIANDPIWTQQKHEE
jgi:hypothetical protein